MHHSELNSTSRYAEPTAVPPLSSYVEPYAVATRTTEKSRATATHPLRRFCRETGDPTPDELTTSAVLAWWDSLDHLRLSTRRQDLKTVRSFTRWLRAQGRMNGPDPVTVVRTPKGGTAYPATFNAEELAAIRCSCRTERETLVIELMASMGLRCIEVARLRVEDLDLTTGIAVIRGKGGHDAELPITERVLRALLLYISANPMTSGPLIRNERFHDPTPVSSGWISKTVADITRRAFPRRQYDNRGAHALRRSLATDLLDRGANIRQVQAVLRHESLASTEHYLRRPKTEELRGLLDAG
jgi:site-specific recombinase XerD